MNEAKWFTGARKFPQLVGRTPDGGKIWGGPYTITQVAVFVVGLFVLWNTAWLWARFSLVGNLVAGPGMLVALVYAAGKLPFEKRSPLVVASGWLSAAERLINTPVPARVLRPHRVGGSVLMIIPDLQVVEEPADSTELTSQETSPAAEPVLTGVQLLLAARSQSC
ncbi:hypothetical protein [Propionicimonas sp.]|uniref:hypothetical protein n=1 Tax=Propionicimonas sp. TaxID=1955623 RepID=UPI001856CB50|nr:hypothetical protein [Propionicimonas sp.]MBA3019633.1 hypothetical protein [Propionicimonas sp.]MBU4208022.1 hypothetical protein [Actinomycetota bacterium]MCG2805752.1 hypothetical protein [Propionicimonas sp.]